MSNEILETMLSQIGGGNVLAISGGRVGKINDTTLRLPVAKGYAVEVEYIEGQDLYTVRRVMKRNGIHVKGTQERVYCDEVGEVAYRASCYLDPFGE